jgi:ABC-type nitrate/sulfonate/bicarbonate transport system substrate-binding protein
MLIRCEISACVRSMCYSLLCVCTLAQAGEPAQALETVNLQFKWSHAFQFAGYYAALEQGYYREAGLDVRLLEAGPGIDALESVLSGQAQYGVGTSSLLLARAAGKPVVVLAVVFQHSPLVLVARQDLATPGTQGIHDLVGKRVMIEPQSDELFAYLKQEGIGLDRLVQVPHSFEPEDLIAGRVDAMSAYVTNEPYYLEASGLAYQTYTPRSAGIDFYGDNLFTTEQELKDIRNGCAPSARPVCVAGSMRWSIPRRSPISSSPGIPNSIRARSICSRPSAWGRYYAPT